MRTSRILSALGLVTALAAGTASTGVADATPARCAGHVVTVFIGQGQHPTNGPDVILGTTGDDEVRAGPGADLVCGRGGDDLLFGGRGADHLYGQTGDDVLHGQRGDDFLYGGKGGDYTGGEAGNDFCDVGPGPGDEGDTSCESGTGGPH